MPARSTVVSVSQFVPAQPPGARRAAVAGPVSVYRILRTTEVDPYDRPVARTRVPPLGVAVATAPPGDSFAGTARRAAKLSVASAQVESFDDLNDLIATLPSDSEMKKHKPKIGVSKTSGRVSEEERNVKVRAFLYAASREDDNDFHLIIGRKPTTSLVCMTAEISGLAPGSSKSFARIKRGRDAYKGFFQDNLPGPTYDFYDPPIPIEIQGSLFFDMSHASGSHPGPQKLRPRIPTIWEIHPVTNIVFEPEA
jgi:hypothetical protein